MELNFEPITVGVTPTSEGFTVHENLRLALALQFIPERYVRGAQPTRYWDVILRVSIPEGNVQLKAHHFSADLSKGYGLSFPSLMNPLNLDYTSNQQVMHLAEGITDVYVVKQKSMLPHFVAAENAVEIRLKYPNSNTIVFVSNTWDLRDLIKAPDRKNVAVAA